MRRSEFAHLLRSAAKIANDPEVVVIGSQSILGSFDEDQLPDQAVASMEADIAFFADPNNTKSDAVDAAIGEDSAFHQMYGYYAQGVEVGTAMLPTGWRDRVVVYADASTAPGRGVCLDPHDLAISKLAATREKDYEFVWALLLAGLLDIDLLRNRADLFVEPIRRRSIVKWLQAADGRLERIRGTSE